MCLRRFSSFLLTMIKIGFILGAKLFDLPVALSHSENPEETENSIPPFARPSTKPPLGKSDILLSKCDADSIS